MIARRALVVELPSVDCDIVRLQALTNLAYRYKELKICPEDLTEDSMHNALQEELRSEVRDQA